MGTAAFPFLNPVAAELKRVKRAPTAKALSRERRQIQAMIAISYVIDGSILLVYAHAGAVPATVGPTFCACGLLAVVCYLTIAETGLIDRFPENYFVAPQLIVNAAIMLAFSYYQPEVGILFLCDLFVVFGFGALRFTPVQTAISWTITTLGLAALFLLTEKSISIPAGTYLERLTTMAVFALTIGRCICLGMFSSSVRQSLYQSGLKLKEAYKRIEELAELDELTGSFNRRSIMGMLDDAVDCAHLANSPCSVALIDLDWFKRINDAFGHPTGDEVLRAFAITVFANIRSNDKFGRYGGEEFLLVLPDTPNQEAMHLLDRLREIIAGLDWSAFSSGMQVTISAGIATLLPDETADTILRRADNALYSAKAKGRNRTANAWW